MFLVLLILQVPLFAGAFSSVPRSVVSGVVLACFTIVLACVLGTRSASPRKVLFSGIFLAYLSLQWAHVTWISQSHIGSMAALRYFVYFLILLGFARERLSRISLSTIATALLTGLVASVIYGVLTDNYVFVNGVDRFRGASHSAAALGLHGAVTLVAVLAARMDIDGTKQGLFRRSIALTTLAVGLCLVTIVLTRSRQPQLGIALVALVWMIRSRPLATAVGIALVSSALVLFPISLPEQVVLAFERTAALAAAVSEAVLTREIGAVDEASVLARVRYTAVGYDYIVRQGHLFGVGPNGFPFVFEQYSTRRGVAPHNDVLMIAMDFGVIGLAILSVFLLKVGADILRYRTRVSAYIALFWLLALSANNPTYYFSVFIPLCIIFAKRREYERSMEVGARGSV